MLIIDEGWLALDDPGFAAQLREWLKTLRKKNASVVFATQSLADIETSPIAPAIIESCPTRIFLPNERAIEPQILAIYRRFGLNDRQIEIIARATPKRDYYCQSRRGNRLFELGLGPLALALCAASSKNDQRAISQLVAEYGREGFARAWLTHRGLRWAADLLPNPDIFGDLVMIRKRSLVAATAVAILLSLNSPSSAQLAVFDPTNYAQNVMTAANTLRQINNQITSLQNEAQMLINQGKNLANLPYSSLQSLQQSIGETQQLLNKAQRIAYDVRQIDQAFSTQYGPANVSASSASLIDGARQRWQNSLAALQDAMRVQAGIVQSIDTARSEARTLLSSSQSAVGALQASQAGNQLLALQSKQLADVTALLASQGRAQSLELARQAEAQEQAREQMRRFIAPGQGYQPGNVAMFH